jgi:RNA polymerase sigma-70 factor (ECF subfamily)
LSRRAAGTRIALEQNKEAVMQATFVAALDEEPGFLNDRWRPALVTAQPAETSDLIDAARLGDDQAFSRLVNQYLATAHRLAQQILRTEEAAADAVQDALIKVHRALPRFQDGNFRSWLLRIVTNTCYDYLRSQRRRLSVSLDEITEDTGSEFQLLCADAAENPETVVTQRESMRFLIQSIEELPEWHRDVVLLVDVHGYDYSEAANILELPLGTVKSRLSRARATLRDHLVAAGHVSDH